MADLSVEIAGIKMRNPLVAASGSITHTLLRIKKAEEHHCGAVITKAIVLDRGTIRSARPAAGSFSPKASI